jgi:hypothetical protein
MALPNHKALQALQFWACNPLTGSYLSIAEESTTIGPERNRVIACSTIRVSCIARLLNVAHAALAHIVGSMVETSYLRFMVLWSASNINYFFQTNANSSHVQCYRTDFDVYGTKTIGTSDIVTEFPDMGRV